MEEFLKFGRFKREFAKIQGGRAPLPPLSPNPCQRAISPPSAYATELGADLHVQNEGNKISRSHMPKVLLVELVR